MNEIGSYISKKGLEYLCQLKDYILPPRHIVKRANYKGAAFILCQEIKINNAPPPHPPEFI